MQFVVSLNLHRRHLTSDQRAACAVEAEELIGPEKEAAKERQRAGKSADGNAGGRSKKKNLTEKIPQGLRRAPESRDRIATTFQTNGRCVADMAKIKQADQAQFTQKEIAVKLGAPRETVRNWLAENITNGQSANANNSTPRDTPPPPKPRDHRVAVPKQEYAAIAERPTGLASS